MQLKKLFLLAVCLFTTAQAQEAQETPPSEQFIAICQELQTQCSKQVDQLEATLQQLKASVQSDEKAIPAISAYLIFTHELQALSVQNAEPETLLNLTIILKNMIDRLTVAVDDGLDILEVPKPEDLCTPDKNFDGSIDYLIKTLTKNNDRLTELYEKSGTIGLTTRHKFFRKLDPYKVPIIATLSLLTVGGIIVLAHNTLDGGLDIIKNPTHPLNGYWKEGGLIAGGGFSTLIMRDAYEATIGESTRSYVKSMYNFITSYGTKALQYGSNWYSSNLLGIKNTYKDLNLFTRLENTPGLDDPSLIGLDDQKQELMYILAQLENPERYVRSGNELPKGIIFAGDSGNGKTALAKALAATINKFYDGLGNGLKIEFLEVNHYIIKSRDILAAYIQKALDNAPCILFIDEIHLLNLQKTGDSTLLNEFLTQLTELHKIKDPKKQVFIIGATNHPELLAPELFRHERFGKVIHFKKPGIKDRTQFFEQNCTKYGINPQAIDILSLVLQTKDCNFSHLQQIIKEARFQAQAQGQGVRQQHLQNAINRIIHGIGAQTVLTPQEAQIAAVDQAGKIVAHYKLGINEILHLVTINKVEGKVEESHLWADKKDAEIFPVHYGTLIATSDHEEIPDTDARELEKICKRHVAGMVAQDILLGKHYIDYTLQDYKKALEIAEKIILNGLAVKTLPQEQQNRLFDECKQLLERYKKEVHELLSQHKELVERVRQELLKEHTLIGKQIDNIVN